MCGLDDGRADDDFCAWCGGELPLDGWAGIRMFCSYRCKVDHATARKNRERREARAGRSCQVCSGPIPITRNVQAATCGARDCERENRRRINRRYEANLRRQRERAANR